MEQFGPTGISGTSFEGGLLWPVWSSRSVGPKCPFPFDKIFVPSTPLLYHTNVNVDDDDDDDDDEEEEEEEEEDVVLGKV